MSETPTTPANDCWCRNCDKAAKAILSPLEAMRLGTRFIVCPDCGNKRCPRGTNHELACTNSNEAGQPGSEWENVKPASGFTELTTEQLEANRRSVYAYAVPPAPELLSAERLADISAKSCRLLPRILAGFPDGSVMVLIDGIDDLLAHAAAQAEQIRLLTDDLDVHRAIVSQDSDHEFMLMHKLDAAEARTDAAEARAAEAEAQVAMLRVELAVEQAKTALLWPVATKQHLTHPGGGHLIICECSARSDNECTCKESQATL